MAHIWAGQGGLSNPDYGLRSEWEDSTVEQFCNRVAAETLVPGEDFGLVDRPTSPSLSDHLRDLSRHYKVSAMVILRQAHDFDLLPTATYRESYSELVEQASKVEPAGEPGGNFYYTLAARNGQRFTEAVISSAAEGTLMSSEAADMLGVKVKTLPGLPANFSGVLDPCLSIGWIATYSLRARRGLMGLISRPGFGCLLTNWLQEAVTCRNLGVTGSHTRKPTEREIPVE